LALIPRPKLKKPQNYSCVCSASKPIPQSSIAINHQPRIGHRCQHQHNRNILSSPGKSSHQRSKAIPTDPEAVLFPKPGTRSPRKWPLPISNIHFATLSEGGEGCADFPIQRHGKTDEHDDGFLSVKSLRWPSMLNPQSSATRARKRSIDIPK